MAWGRGAGERRRPSAFSAVIAALVVVALVIAGIAAWQVWGTSWRASAATRQAMSDFSAGCSAGRAQADQNVVAVMSIPSLGVETPVVRGVGKDSLRRGVGWYPDTAAPGQSGNFAVAGYRITNGAPLRHILQLKDGDQIRVRDCRHSYTYSVEMPASGLTVGADAGWVLDAVPGHPERIPSQALMTITANQDQVPSDQRAVLFARLVTG
ncbi:sortase domain-bontaining protein [Propionibacterium sp.]|uniref:sortase domain-containing protein n=1 Tax=Propionibacterium sp. TaxID=1977903 RepID=UPI0039EB8D9C